MLPINAMGAEKIVELSPGDIAKFHGNLVPPIKFQEMMIELREKSLLEEELSRCKRECENRPDSYDATLLVVGSLLSGFVIGAIFGRYVKFP